MFRTEILLILDVAVYVNANVSDITAGSIFRVEMFLQ
jgi:hypothetical protein